jgi:hypothetical protein
MFKLRGDIMTQVLDHVDDTNGVELYKLAKTLELPEFVKKASPAQTLHMGEQPISVYADYFHRKYPCHNAASTWLSAAYFQEKQAHYHPKKAGEIQQRLDKFAAYWGIKGDVDKMRVEHAASKKVASDQLSDDDFAFVWTDGDTKHRSLRMVNALETKRAAEWLHEHQDKLPFSDRNVIATKILEKAARFGASLGAQERFIEKQAGHGVCRPQEVYQLLQNRSVLAKTAQHREGIVKLAATIQHSPANAMTPDMLVKLASTIDMIDRAIGLVGRYSANIPRPEDVIFRDTYKEVRAAAEGACALTSGTLYAKEDFSKIKLASLQALFGKDFANDVRGGLDSVDPEKLAEMASTMPRDDAEIFDKLAREAGVSPMQTKAASAPMKVPQAVLEAAGAAY